MRVLASRGQSSKYVTVVFACVSTYMIDDRVYLMYYLGAVTGVHGTSIERRSAT